MKTLLQRYAPVFDTGGEPSGGGAAPAAPAAGDPPAAGSQPAAGAPGDGSGAPDPGGQPPAPAGDIYRPEGLPETMFGANDRETIDKMANTLKGYRDRDANRQVPDKPDAYLAFDLEQMPESVRGQIGELSKDPLFGKVAETALTEGVPVATLHKLTAALYGAGAEAGMFEDYLDVEKERAALLPESAKALPKAQQDQAIDARMKENEDFIKLMVTNGQLAAEAGEHALLMLMDTANGNQFIEWVKGKVDGGAAPLIGGKPGSGGQDTREGLKAELAKPEMQPGHHLYNQKARQDLQERYQKMIGD
jgi:hypothetical protein